MNADRCTGVGRFRACLHKWEDGLSAGWECGAEKQILYHIFLKSPIQRPIHGRHGLTALDDETLEWLLNT